MSDSLRESREGSSTIRETVLGGLATAIGAEEEEEEDEEEEDEEEEGVELLLDSMEGLGGSRACLGGGGGSCWESGAGRGSGAKRTPADSTEDTHTDRHIKG